MSDIRIVEIGRALTRGALVEVAKWCGIGFGFVLVVGVVAQAAGYGWDDTDNRPTGVHSEMRLRTDHGTGCQYLESQEGALTPRVDRSGRQVCR
jgi:hypothetical protein